MRAGVVGHGAGECGIYDWIMEGLLKRADLVIDAAVEDRASFWTITVTTRKRLESRGVCGEVTKSV